ncbi:MAG: hypothetical protein IKO08_07030 [Bacteroidales bacterium]|nr:hypothetical protein [Bacteroidales bacterium]
MNQELTVEVTEFDNLRNEYMQYEAAGEDYINMLDARLMSEYRSYVEEDPVAAEDYLAAGKALIRELSDWAASERHQADTDFVANTLHKLEEEVQRQHFTPLPDDRAWIYLAGEQNVCLHYGNDTDNVRLVYTRDGVDECIKESVRLLCTKREAREAELQRTLQLMRDALQQSQHNTRKLDRNRLLRSFHCPMIAYKVAFLEGIIKDVATKKTEEIEAKQHNDNKHNKPQDKRGKGFDPELNQCYRQFVEDLAEVTAPLVMAGDGKTVLFRFALSIPKKGEISVSWDAFNCRNYLYGHTFAVQQDYLDDLRSWWATSCIMEMKRLKM